MFVNFYNGGVTTVSDYNLRRRDTTINTFKQVMVQISI